MEEKQIHFSVESYIKFPLIKTKILVQTMSNFNDNIIFVDWKYERLLTKFNISIDVKEETITTME